MIRTVRYSCRAIDDVPVFLEKSLIILYYYMVYICSWLSMVNAGDV